MVRGAALLFAALAALSSPACAGTPDASEIESITIHHRLTGIVCTGICDEYDVTVRADGLVEYRGWKIGHRSPKRLRFRLSPEAHAQFVSMLRPVRPAGRRGPVGSCEDEAGTLDNIGFDISWRGNGPDGRLLVCDDQEMWDRAYKAFEVLKINTSHGYHWEGDEGEAFEAWLRAHPEAR
jgi:hypothetical protein